MNLRELFVGYISGVATVAITLFALFLAGTVFEPSDLWIVFVTPIPLALARAKDFHDSTTPPRA